VAALSATTRGTTTTMSDLPQSNDTHTPHYCATGSRFVPPQTPHRSHAGHDMPHTAPSADITPSTHSIPKQQQQNETPSLHLYPPQKKKSTMAHRCRLLRLFRLPRITTLRRRRRSSAPSPAPPPPHSDTAERQARRRSRLASRPKYVPPSSFDLRHASDGGRLGLRSRRRSRHRSLRGQGQGRPWSRGSA